MPGLCALFAECWGCVPLQQTQPALGMDLKRVQVSSAVISWFGSIFPRSKRQSNTSSSVPASVPTCIPSLGCAETSRAGVNPHPLLCQRDRGAASPVAASGNPNFGNNRATTEPSSCFSHPNMCEWQSCSLLLPFLTPCQPSSS